MTNINAQQTEPDWVPDACTLPAVERPTRLAELDELFASAVDGLERTDPTRLVLRLAPAPGRADAVRDLARRETECCSFFDFTVTEQGEELRLAVVVPTAHVDVLDALADRAAQAIGRPR